MKRISFAFVALCLLILAASSLQAQMGPPAPAPELKNLDFLSGDWTSEGNINPGPGMPNGGKFSESSHTEWMDGKYFLVTHSDGDFGAMGKAKELAVFGYDSDHKMFTYTSFSSNGEANTSTGTANGDTWIWTSDEHMGGMTMKGRFTMKVLSPTSYTMKYELSQDGTNWMTAMEGKATKK